MACPTLLPKPRPPRSGGPHRTCRKLLRRLEATIRHGGNRAYYAHELDYVQMPPFESFRDAESYYATLAHEMTHWTKHPRASRGISVASNGAMKATRRKNSSPSWAPRSCALIWNCIRAARGECLLHRQLAGSSEERYTLHLQGRRPRAARRRLPQP